jgi:hypothetical protein
LSTSWCDDPLRLPIRSFAITAAWLTAAMIAVDLHAFAQTLPLHDTGLARAGSSPRAWCLTVTRDLLFVRR